MKTKFKAKQTQKRKIIPMVSVAGFILMAANTHATEATEMLAKQDIQNVINSTITFAINDVKKELKNTKTVEMVQRVKSEIVIQHAE